MISLLQQYVRINTSLPQNYGAAVDLFKQRADKDGFVTKVITLPSGYPVLIITLEGSDGSLPALLLNHHMDVVPADSTGWVADPFSGYYQDDVLIGRGVQDMKGVGVVHYEALVAFKSFAHKPQRTVHLVLVPDEEKGGFKGTKQFLEHPQFEDLGIGYVLDEGMPSGDAGCILIKVAERTPLQIKITSKGKAAHSSLIEVKNAIYELVSFLHVLKGYHDQELSKISSAEQGLLCSYQVTSFLAGSQNALTIIPHEATAIVDIRMPPSIEHAHIRYQLDELCAQYPSVSYEVVATSYERMHEACQEACFYQALAQAIRESGLNPKPHYFEATTDTRFYVNKGMQGLGITPFTIKPNLHGINESLRGYDLELGKRIILSFLTLFCSQRKS